MYRTGLMFGFGAELGSISAVRDGGGDSAATVLTQFEFGYAFRPRFAVGLSLFRENELYFKRRDADHEQTSVRAFFQYWVVPRIWLRADAGITHYGRPCDSGTCGEATGTQVGATAGIELLHRRAVSIDLDVYAARTLMTSDDNFLNKLDTKTWGSHLSIKLHIPK